MDRRRRARRRRRAGGPGPQPRACRVGLPRRCRRRRLRHTGHGPARRGRRRPTGSSWTRHCPTTTGGGRPSSCARARAGTGRPTPCASSAREDPERPAGIDLPLSTAPFTFTVDCPSDLDCAPATEHRPGIADLLPGRLPRPRLRGAAQPAARPARDPPARLDRPQPGRPGRHARRALRGARRPARLLAGRRRGRGLPRHRPSAHVRAPTRPAARLHRARGLLGAHAPRVHDRLRPHPAAWHARHRPARPAGRRGALAPRCRRGRGHRLRDGDRPGGQPGAQRPAPARLGRPVALPAGRGHRSLRRTPSGTDPGLLAGDLVVLVDRPVGGTPREGDPSRRFGVRLVEDARAHTDPLAPSLAVWELHWGAADALPAPLTVTTPGTDESTRRRARQRRPGRPRGQRRRRGARASDGARARTTTGPGSSGRASAGSTDRCPPTASAARARAARRAVGRSVARPL